MPHSPCSHLSFLLTDGEIQAPGQPCQLYSEDWGKEGTAPGRASHSLPPPTSLFAAYGPASPQSLEVQSGCRSPLSLGSVDIPSPSALQPSEGHQCREWVSWCSTAPSGTEGLSRGFTLRTEVPKQNPRSLLWMCLNRPPPSGRMALSPQGLVLGFHRQLPCVSCQAVGHNEPGAGRSGAENSKSLRRSAEASPGSAESTVGAATRDVHLVKDFDPKYQGEDTGTGSWTLWGFGCVLRFGSGVIVATGHARWI